MASNHVLSNCLRSSGPGEVQRLEVAEGHTDGQLASQLRAFGTEVTFSAGEPVEPATVAAGCTPRDFQREVHSWNPQLAMWRRSPKE
jgi:hypothetical protein